MHPLFEILTASANEIRGSYIYSVQEYWNAKEKKSRFLNVLLTAHMLRLTIYI